MKTRRASFDRVVPGHGSGGRLNGDLIEQTILPALNSDALAPLDDCALLSIGGGTLAFSTDSFVVCPMVFPGGDIGELAVNGTVNKLAVGGARPIALSLAFILEEGLALTELERAVASAQAAAKRAGVPIVTGDTKVVSRGAAERMFINTSGVGTVAPGVVLGSARVRPGDVVLVSGAVGDHGITLLACREGLALAGDLASDTAPLTDLAQAILAAAPATHAMRDPTRGGIGRAVCEIAARRRLGIAIDAAAIPVHEPVRRACELLGLDPLLLANEGKLLAFVPEHQADAALAAMRAHPLGREAARIGRVEESHPGAVLLRAHGADRVLDLPLIESLPRSC